MAKKNVVSAADEAADKALLDHQIQTRREATGGIYQAPNVVKDLFASPVYIVDKEDTQPAPTIASEDWPAPENIVEKNHPRSSDGNEAVINVATKKPDGSIEVKNEPSTDH